VGKRNEQKQKLGRKHAGTPRDALASYYVVSQFTLLIDVWLRVKKMEISAALAFGYHGSGMTLRFDTRRYKLTRNMICSLLSKASHLNWRHTAGRRLNRCPVRGGGWVDAVLSVRWLNLVFEFQTNRNALVLIKSIAQKLTVTYSLAPTRMRNKTHISNSFQNVGKMIRVCSV